MAKKAEVLDALDNPFLFTFVIALTTVAWLAILSWGFKAAGLPGPAGLLQHP